MHAEEQGICNKEQKDMSQIVTQVDTQEQERREIDFSRRQLLRVLSVSLPELEAYRDALSHANFDNTALYLCQEIAETLGEVQTEVNHLTTLLKK